jgi:hypothetical protein
MQNERPPHCYFTRGSHPKHYPFDTSPPTASSSKPTPRQQMPTAATTPSPRNCYASPLLTSPLAFLLALGRGPVPGLLPAVGGLACPGAALTVVAPPRRTDRRRSPHQGSLRLEGGRASYRRFPHRNPAGLR